MKNKVRSLLIMITACIGISHGYTQTIQEQSNIRDELRKSYNPFKPDMPIHYITIHVFEKSDSLNYTINERSTTFEELDNLLGKLSNLDKNQTIIVEMDKNIQASDLNPLLVLLKKHNLTNAARRGEDDAAIWLFE